MIRNAIAAMAFLSVTANHGAEAQQSRLHVLHDICAREACGSGGTGSSAGLFRDANGNLFGATLRGGTANAGEIFELTPKPDGKHWDYTRLYSFCPKAGCKSGAIVWGPLIGDTQGNLYGVTTIGGRHSFGTLFELSPNPPKAKWAFKVLYAFRDREANGFNLGLTYAGAATGAAYDGASPLYGVSEQGGTGFGNVYMLSPHAGHKSWSFRQIYAFCSNGQQCADGGLPWMGTIIADLKGDLYGTATIGGANNQGVVYALSSTGKNTWTETVLYSFCALADCADGRQPSGTLLLDGSGNLYGTTMSGNSNCADAQKCGVVFRLSPGAPWQETVLHTFCQEPGCVDGSGAGGGLITDRSGDLLGTTYAGGAQNAGTVFRLGQSYSVLYNFCSQPDCADGQSPWAAIASDPAGDVYGMSSKGGAASYGTVFELRL